MNLSPPALARYLFFPALVLILWAAAGFILHSKVWALDVAYGVLVIVFGIVCSFQAGPNREPRTWRILFGLGVAAILATCVVRPLTSWRPELEIAIRMVSGGLGACAVALGACGLLGSALALREDPSNQAYRGVSLAGSVVALCGIAVFMLNEVTIWLQYRSRLIYSTPFSINTVFTLLLRGSLCFSCVVAFGKAVTEPGIRRKHSLILKGMLVHVALQVLIALLSVAGSMLSRSGEYREDLKRLAWVNGLSVLLLLINPVLLSLAFRKPKDGYKSTPTPNPSSGAEA